MMYSSGHIFIPKLIREFNTPESAVHT